MILTHQEIEILCSMGNFAPSGGNSQPWLIDVFQKKLEIRLHSSILHPSTPPAYIKGSIFSLGMFAENVCIASEKLGLDYKLIIHSPDNLTDCFATFDYTGRTSVHPDDSALYSVIKSRVTNRKGHNGENITSEQIDELQAVSKPDDKCGLFLISDKNVKNNVIKILAKADVIRMKNKKLFHAMLDEIRWTPLQSNEAKDGIDTKTLELSGMDLFSLRLIKNYPILTKILPSKIFESSTKNYLSNSSHFGCVSLEKDITPNLFYCGQIAQRTWLTATKLGLSFQPWTILPFMGMDILNSVR